jgi:hypothetical protein
MGVAVEMVTVQMGPLELTEPGAIGGELLAGDGLPEEACALNGVRDVVAWSHIKCKLPMGGDCADVRCLHAVACQA